jgi:phosphate transport system protein
MSQINKDIQRLKELAIDMMQLVKTQLINSKDAIVKFDLDLAETILRTELRVNASELIIEKECENVIALQQPVASDLRFILSIYKMVSELERIGDHAVFMAKTLQERTKPFNEDLLMRIDMEKMFDKTLSMFDDVIFALNNQDANSARKVFKKDKDVNKRFRDSVVIFNSEIIKINPDSEDFLLLYANEARLERTGNLLTNVAEEIIFYIEAKVLKHNKPD